MEEEINYLRKEHRKLLNKASTIDRKHDEDCRKAYNRCIRKMELIENIIKALKEGLEDE